MISDIEVRNKDTYGRKQNVVFEEPCGCMMFVYGYGDKIGLTQSSCYDHSPYCESCEEHNEDYEMEVYFKKDEKYLDKLIECLQEMK